MALWRGARSAQRGGITSSFASEGTTFGPAGPRDSQPGSQPALGMGLLATTTTVSVKGIHM